MQIATLPSGSEAFKLKKFDKHGGGFGGFGCCGGFFGGNKFGGIGKKKGFKGKGKIFKKDLIFD